MIIDGITINEKAISETDKIRVENGFKASMTYNKIKYGTKTYLKYQTEYFIGAMVALDCFAPYWLVCLMSGRPILDN